MNGPRLKLHRGMLVGKESADNEALNDFQPIVAFLFKNATLRDTITEVSSFIRIILSYTSSVKLLCRKVILGKQTLKNISFYDPE